MTLLIFKVNNNGKKYLYRILEKNSKNTNNLD